MIELVIFLGGMLLILFIAALILFAALKFIGRMGKSAANGAGSLLTDIEHEAGGLLSNAKAPSHGKLLDEAEAFGARFIHYGALTEAEWQPMFATIATGLTHTHAKPAAPETEAPAAA